MESQENKKTKKWFLPLIIIICICLIMLGIIFYNKYKKSLSYNTVGNSVANVANGGYVAEENNIIYFIAQDEEGTNRIIYRADENGNNKKELLKKSWNIKSLNVYKDNLYFIAIDPYDIIDNDIVNNRIYKMSTNGKKLEIINDNEFNNNSNSIFIINDKIYYVDEENNICSMSLDGKNKSIIDSDGEFLLGVTENYIIYNQNIEQESGSIETITYKMSLNGENKEKITGKELTNINCLDNDIHFTDEARSFYKMNLETKETTKIADLVFSVNVTQNKVFFLRTIKDTLKLGIFKVDLDGKNEELIIKLNSYYNNIFNAFKNNVLYTDSDSEGLSMILINSDTKESNTVYEYKFKRSDVKPQNQEKDDDFIDVEIVDESNK